MLLSAQNNKRPNSKRREQLIQLVVIIYRLCVQVDPLTYPLTLDPLPGDHLSHFQSQEDRKICDIRVSQLRVEGSTWNATDEERDEKFQICDCFQDPQ